LWKAAFVLSEHDTTHATVGSIWALSVGEKGLPVIWYEICEPISLQNSIFINQWIWKRGYCGFNGHLGQQGAGPNAYSSG